eukprot:3269129-Rhodomonas_salina.1
MLPVMLATVPDRLSHRLETALVNDADVGARADDSDRHEQGGDRHPHLCARLPEKGFVALPPPPRLPSSPTKRNLSSSKQISKQNLFPATSLPLSSYALPPILLRAPVPSYALPPILLRAR